MSKITEDSRKVLESLEGFIKTLKKDYPTIKSERLTHTLKGRKELVQVSLLLVEPKDEKKK